MEKRRISINDAPKGFKVFFMLLPLIGCILIKTTLNNDFYFLYPTGQYIIENGFPVKDFLSMHTGMNIIVQQWLCDIWFYLLYSKLGAVGVVAFIFICYFIFCFIMYKLMMLITNNNFFISCITACVADVLMAAMYYTTRPQAVTFIIIALEIYALEKFVRTKKTAYLIILPLISLFLINWHCSMWFMLFVFALPYAFEALPIKIGKFRQTPCCSFLKLFVCGIICFALGFANPYGIKAITYIFYSYGIGEINHYISEMQPADFSSLTGIVYLACLGVAFALIAALRKKNYAARFVLLFVGTAILAPMNNKSVAYFIIGAFPAFAYYLNDCNIELTITESEKTKKDKTKIAVLVSLMVLIAAVGCTWLVINPQTETVKELNEKNVNVYSSLDEITEILDKSEDDVVLYTGFNYGQYMEFKGYHPYIDGRAELFLKNNNGEYDYLVEHVNLQSGKVYYKDVFNKYKFNYVIIDKNELLLNTEMSKDNDFEKIYDSESVDLYKLK